MLEKYLRKKFGKFVPLGEFGNDAAVERALKRYRLKKRLMQVALSLALLLPVIITGFIKFGAGKGKESPKSSSEYYLLGAGAYEKAEYERAADYFQKSIEAGGDGAFLLDTLIKLGNSYFNMTWFDREQTYRKALECYQKALGAGTSEQLAPNLAWIYYQMGNCQRNVRAFKRSFDADYKSAVNYYDEVITNYSSSTYAPNSLYYKAECYRDAGDYDKAREIYCDVYERYPAHPLSREAFFNVGDCYLEEAKRIGETKEPGVVDLVEIKTE